MSERAILTAFRALVFFFENNKIIANFYSLFHSVFPVRIHSTLPFFHLNFCKTKKYKAWELIRFNHNSLIYGFLPFHYMFPWIFSCLDKRVTDSNNTYTICTSTYIEWSLSSTVCMYTIYFMSSSIWFALLPYMYLCTLWENLCNTITWNICLCDVVYAIACIKH